MHSADRFGVSKSLVVAVAIAISLFALQCVAQSQTPPQTLNAPYSVSVGAGFPNKSPIKVLESPNFQLLLELDRNARCAITVRRRYSSTVAHLVWTANYDAGTPPGSTKCTLTFTAGGDLQLFMFYRQQTRLAWSSKTAGKGATKMTMDDTGNFQLLSRANKVIFGSFDHKEFAIVSKDRLRLGQILKSPDTAQVDGQDDDNLPVLFNKGDFVLAFNKGDLELRTSDPKPLVYWSLKRTLFKGGDLSQVNYAAIIPKTGGIGLFTASGKLLWASSLPPQGFFGDNYFAIDKFGNLKNFYMYKGVTWFSEFRAIEKDCDLPNFCGLSSICSYSGTTTRCSCPSKFVRVGGRDVEPACTHQSAVAKCKWSSFVELKGYDTVFDLYAVPKKISLAACKASCLKAACNCGGFSYNAGTGACFEYAAFKTIRKVSDTRKSVFVKSS